ncbi:Kinesin-like protein KIF23 [Smittium culicis]|uniref:Kinesin-like protein KIF23 n=1 Tax=Smittium culicis TaxID=133412 RepID=A0A1R1YCX0_9FUNG|nr:Kinesin-like protein KIF23 [Smittium culicis]
MAKKSPNARKKNLKRVLASDSGSETSRKVTRSSARISKAASANNSQDENNSSKNYSTTNSNTNSSSRLTTRSRASNSSGDESLGQSSASSTSRSRIKKNDSIFTKIKNSSKSGKYSQNSRIVPKKNNTTNISLLPPINKYKRDANSSNNHNSASESDSLAHNNLDFQNDTAQKDQKQVSYANSISSFKSSTSVFGSILSGVSSLFSPRKDITPSFKMEIDPPSTPKAYSIPKPSNSDGIMSVPISKTPFTNRKTIADYNQNQDPIETYLRLKNEIISFNEVAKETEKRKNKYKSSNYDSEMKILNDKEIEVTKFTAEGGKKREKYLFAGVLSNKTDERVIYEKTAGSAVSNLFIGKNSLLFAYGVTGSGKTFTMQGNPDNPGLVVKALCEIVLKVQKLNNKSLSKHGKRFGSIIKGGYALRPKFSSQAEWCMDPRIISSNINPVQDEDSWSNFISKLNEKEYEYNSDNLNDDYFSSDESDSNTERFCPHDPWQYSIYLSYYEVYNENIYDLLDLNFLSTTDQYNNKSSFGPKSAKKNNSRNATNKNYNGFYPDIENSSNNTDRRPLQLRSENGKGTTTFIEGLTEIRVATVQDAIRVLLHGQAKRSVFSTNLNSASSRSHALCNIKLLKWKNVPELIPGNPIPDSSSFSISSLLLVDLAGSERAKYTNNTGERLVESSKINVSLMSLKRCMDVLRFNSEVPKDQSHIVPFNESKLTRLFQPALEGGSKTIMIACVDPHQLSGPKNNIGRTETINVLEFSHVASTVLLSNKKNKRFMQDNSIMPNFMSPTVNKGNRVFESTARKNLLFERPNSSLKQAQNSPTVDNMIHNNLTKTKKLVYDITSEDDSHIDLFQLISATKSARTSIVNTENIPDTNMKQASYGTKRTADAEAQTDSLIFREYINNLKPKRQKVDLDGAWKNIDTENLFHSIKKEPLRRRSFPNLNDFLTLPKNIYLPVHNNREKDYYDSTSSTNHSHINSSIHSKNKTRHYDQLRNDKDKRELEKLKAMLLKKEQQLSEFKSKVKSENSTTSSYIKELRDALENAKNEVIETKRNSIMSETEIRRSLSKFYSSHINEMYNKFNCQVEANHDYAENKSLRKVDLLLGVFDNISKSQKKDSQMISSSQQYISMENKQNNAVNLESNSTQDGENYEKYARIIQSLESELKNTKSLMNKYKDNYVSTKLEKDRLVSIQNSSLERSRSPIYSDLNNNMSDSYLNSVRGNNMYPQSGATNIVNLNPATNMANSSSIGNIKTHHFHHSSNIRTISSQLGERPTQGNKFQSKLVSNARSPNESKSPKNVFKNLFLKSFSPESKNKKAIAGSKSEYIKADQNMDSSNFHTKNLNSFGSINLPKINSVKESPSNTSFIINTNKALDSVLVSKNNFEPKPKNDSDSRAHQLNDTNRKGNSIKNADSIYQLSDLQISSANKQNKSGSQRSLIDNNKSSFKNSSFRFSQEESLVLNPNIQPSFHKPQHFLGQLPDLNSNSESYKKSITEYPDLLKKLQSDLSNVNKKNMETDYRTGLINNVITKPLSPNSIFSSKTARSNIPISPVRLNFNNNSSTGNNSNQIAPQRPISSSSKYSVDSTLKAIYSQDKNEIEISSVSSSSSLHKSFSKSQIKYPLKNNSINLQKSPSMPTSPISRNNSISSKNNQSSTSADRAYDYLDLPKSPTYSNQFIERPVTIASTLSVNPSSSSESNSTFKYNSKVSRELNGKTSEKPDMVPKTPSNNIASSLLSSIFNFNASKPEEIKVDSKDSSETLSSNAAKLPSKVPSGDKRQAKNKRKSKSKINKNNGFMLSPLRIFYKLRSRK